ncbi:MAG: histidine kinase N-terminal 7TM domain-containing protein [Salinirussus sp.]
MTDLTPMAVLLLGSIAIGAAGALLAWRERPEPGAVPLAIMLAAQCWWSATLFFRIQALDLGAKIFWLNISWVGVPLIPVGWLFFALEYSGYSQYVRPRYIAGALVIPIVTAILALTNEAHTLLHVSIELVQVGDHVELVRTPGPWFWVAAGYTYLLGALGAIPLFRFVTSDVRPFRGQSVAILVGLAAPWATNILFLAGLLPTGSIDPTPVAFSISGVAYLGALTRFQLFGTSPTPIRPARQSTFERTRDGIIVLDSDQHVVDLNQRAGRILDIPPEELLGRPLDTAIPQLDIGMNGPEPLGRTVYRPTDSNRAYDITRSRVDDVHGRAVGQLVTLHDISDYLRQQQRLEVVNRVYRHNIRSTVQVILGTAEQLEAAGEAPGTVKQKALEITDYTDKIRNILEVFERGRTGAETAQLASMLEHTVESIRSEYPEVEVTASIETGDVEANTIIGDVVRHVLENAAEHNDSDDPSVQLEASAADGQAKIVVTDNGPGIPEDELALLREGTETPLHHGSGVGLAIILWGTEIIGGEISFSENDPKGTVVRLDVPID